MRSKYVNHWQIGQSWVWFFISTNSSLYSLDTQMILGLIDSFPRINRLS